MARYKYLKFCWQPNGIPSSMVDFVDDRKFIKPDGRIPLLITENGQFGLPESISCQQLSNFRDLSLLENQVVGFIGGRQHDNIDEHFKVTEFFLDQQTLKKIMDKGYEILDNIQFSCLNSDLEYDYIPIAENITHEAFVLANHSGVYCCINNQTNISNHGKIQVLKLHT